MVNCFAWRWACAIACWSRVVGIFCFLLVFRRFLLERRWGTSFAELAHVVKFANFFGKFLFAPHRAPHQSTPSLHPVLDWCAGAIFVCFWFSVLKHFHWLKFCKNSPFLEPKQLIETETRFGCEGEHQHCARMLI